MEFSQFTHKKEEEVLKFLETSRDGLSQDEVLNRQKKFGLNEISLKKKGALFIFARQFASSFTYLLLFATLISLLLKEAINAAVIIFFIAINAILGFIQEYRSEKIISLLKTFLPPKVKVRRQSQEIIIERKNLVPGDVVIFKTGDLIPADLRLLKSHNLEVDESVLTGESLPVSKKEETLKKEIKEIFKAKNILFGGTTVVGGIGEGVVISTGSQTVTGKLGRFVASEERESDFEKNIKNLSRFILYLTLITLSIVFLANIAFKGLSRTQEFLLFSIALAVSVIPEALPVVTTISFSKGAFKLAQKKLVVKRLSAIEDLGGIEVLCLDKTGTITENVLKLTKIEGGDKERCLLFALLSSTPPQEGEEKKNPFETALFKAANESLRRGMLDFEKVAEIPFSPERRRSSALLRGKNSLTLAVKGAPEVILSLSKLTLQERKLWEEKIKNEEIKGYRIVAVGVKKGEFDLSYSQDEEKDLEFLGFLSFTDPLKKTAKKSIELSKKLGIEIKILTGDSAEVAETVAYQTGLISSRREVITGSSFGALSDEEKDKAVNTHKVFARVSPEQKVEIIKLLQKKTSVGFVGEGINDAPALKTANVAIAADHASDIAQEASDIILLRKSLKTIVEGIKEGRNIFANVVKYVRYTLIANFGNFYAIAGISLIIDFLPMLPIQILLTNVLSDMPVITIATDQVDVGELLKPKHYNIKEIAIVAMTLGFISTIFDFIFFKVFISSPQHVFQTLWFIESILTELVLIFSIRTRLLFLKAKPPSFVLVFFSLLAAILTVAFPFTRMGEEIFKFVIPALPNLLTVFLIVSCYFVTTEIFKLVYYRFSDQKN